MRRLTKWILSKTNLLRNASISLAGVLVSTGIIEPDGAEAVVAGLVVILTGFLNAWVEAHKDDGVKALQKDLRAAGEDCAVDGVCGEKTRGIIKRRLRR